MSKIENEELYLDKKSITLDRVTAADLDRLLESFEQTELNATFMMMGIVRAFQDSSEFKREVQPLFSDCSGVNIERLVNLAKNKDIVLPHLAEDLQAITGGEKITLNEFFEKKDENGIAPYAAILIKRGKKTYRTKAKASISCDHLPDIIPALSLREYQNATSLYQGGNAYLLPIKGPDNLVFQDGKLFFQDNTAFHGVREATEMELRNMTTKEGIESIDLVLLRTLYGIILRHFENTGYTQLKHVITLYVPDLAKHLGMQGNLNKNDLALLLSKMQSFHNIVGFMYDNDSGGYTPSMLPVLNFEGYSATENTISFSSPYLNRVIKTVYRLSIRRNKRGEILFKSDGSPQLKVWNSYLVKSSLNKERNKAAAENVFIICTLIEQAGRGVPNIRAREIINRNPQLKQRLEQSSKPNQLLKRTFEKTWELLDKSTHLREKYDGIELPDPKNPKNIPTMSNLDIVFRFPHKGKNNLQL